MISSFDIFILSTKNIDVVGEKVNPDRNNFEKIFKKPTKNRIPILYCQNDGLILD